MYLNLVILKIFEIWGSHGGQADDDKVLGFGVMQIRM
jgi:hypothetical protein